MTRKRLAYGGRRVQVQARLSSGLASAAGTPRLTLQLSPGATVAGLLAALPVQCATLRGRLAAVVPVIDGETVGPQRALQEGEEVALLMPMAGG